MLCVICFFRKGKWSFGVSNQSIQFSNFTKWDRKGSSDVKSNNDTTIFTTLSYFTVTNGQINHDMKKYQPHPSSSVIVIMI